MATAFEVLADPRRRQLLDLLRAGERPVGELVDQLGLSQPGVDRLDALARHLEANPE
jgi:DNA-binding transcriptional ArsR family regulator